MTKGQLEARKRRVMQSIKNAQLTSYEKRMIRLKVEQFFIDPRERVQ
jgi:hypothetical protein